MKISFASVLAACLLHGLLFSTDAAAMSKAEASAEHIRLSEEMSKLAKRGHWRGVDRSYRTMESLQRKDVVLTYDDHYLAAQAARELGNVTLVYRRLQRARDVSPRPDVENWIGDILNQYGEVELIIPERYKADANLAVAVMPLQPDQRSTIGMAQQRVTEGKSYNGLLPAGDYTFGPHEFKVTPGGSTIVLDLDKKGGAQVRTRAAGEKEPFRFTYSGPRGDVGVGWTHGIDANGGPQPGDFGGLGARAAFGWEMGVGGPVGVMPQVGYQGLSGSPGDAQGPLDKVAQFRVEPDQMHFAFASLMLTANLGPIWSGVGVVYGLGWGQVTGVTELCIDKPNDAACSRIDGTTNILRYSRMQGRIRAAGGTLGAAYSLMSFGKFDGAVTLNAGALSDASRMYPFGVLGFTVGPGGLEDDE